MTLEDAAWNHFKSLKTNRPGMKDRISMYSSKRVVKEVVKLRECLRQYCRQQSPIGPSVAMWIASG